MVSMPRVRSPQSMMAAAASRAYPFWFLARLGFQGAAHGVGVVRNDVRYSASDCIAC